MSSGIAVNEECIERFEDLQKNKVYRYVIYKINEDKTQIVVDSLGNRGETYDDFFMKMKGLADAKNCRYAVFDLEGDRDNNVKANVIFFLWCADNCNVKDKMIYTSSWKAFSEKLKGVTQNIQANDEDDLSYGTVSRVCLDKYNR